MLAFDLDAVDCAVLDLNFVLRRVEFFYYVFTIAVGVDNQVITFTACNFVIAAAAFNRRAALRRLDHVIELVADQFNRIFIRSRIDRLDFIAVIRRVDCTGERRFDFQSFAGAVEFHAFGHNCVVTVAD